MFHITHFLLTKALDRCLNSILSLAIVLVLAYGGGKVVREMVIDDMVDCVGEGCLGVEKALLVNGDDWAYVVDVGSGEWTCVDGVTFSVGTRHFGLRPVNGV